MSDKEVVERLATLEANTAHIRAAVERLAHAIDGNGKPGVRVRLDRLEQSEGKRVRFLWLVVAAVVGLVAKEGVVTLRPDGSVTVEHREQGREKSDTGRPDREG